MVDASLQLVYVGDRGQDAARDVRVGLASAVHGLDALWDDDNERRAHQHTCAKECDDAQLAR